MNSADRSFGALVAIAVVPYLAVGMFACGVMSWTVYRLATGGWSDVTDDGRLLSALPVLVILAAGTVLAAASVVRQLSATRALAQVVRSARVDASPKVAIAAERSGIGRLDVVASAEPHSFTYGVRRPRVAVTTAFVNATSPAELEAILRHESYHLRNGDTVKVVLARALTAALFFLPVLRHLRRRYLEARELAADRAAMRANGPVALAGALLKSVVPPERALIGAAAALSGTGALDARVTQLENGEEPPLGPIPRRAIVGTAAGLAVMLGGAVIASIARSGVGDGRMMASGGAMAVVGPVLCVAGWAVIVTVVVRRLARHSPREAIPIMQGGQR